MKELYCPECGHQNPTQARFCMRCGHSLAGYPPLTEGEGQPATARSGGEDTDWATILTMVFAALGLRHMSRKAREIGCLLLFFLLFFGGPMACGLVMFLANSLVELFR
jgi:hypothetical protein